MNRNCADTKDSALQSLAASMIWHQRSAAGLSVAASVDAGQCSESSLIELLSVGEKQRVDQLRDPIERRHFVFRRCFQRLFLKHVLNWQDVLPEIRIIHQLDTRPVCLDAPDLGLSFSSSGSTVVASAIPGRHVGIDVERIRVVENASQLAQRFFTAAEAAEISTCAPDETNSRFLHFWTGKEAGLKAIGKGIADGFNRAAVTCNKASYDIDIVGESGVPGKWVLRHMDLLPSHIVAVVHNSSDSRPVSL